MLEVRNRAGGPMTRAIAVSACTIPYDELPFFPNCPASAGLFLAVGA